VVAAATREDDGSLALDTDVRETADVLDLETSRAQTKPWLRSSSGLSPGTPPDADLPVASVTVL
jgi:hypothetical protein